MAAAAANDYPSPSNSTPGRCSSISPPTVASLAPALPASSEATPVAPQASVGVSFAAPNSLGKSTSRASNEPASRSKSATPNNGQHNARRGSGYMPFPSTEPISAYPPIEVGMPSFRLDPDNPGSASDNDSMDLDEEARQPSLKPETLAEQEVGSSSAYSAAGSAAAPETFEPDIGERIKRHRRSASLKAREVQASLHAPHRPQPRRRSSSSSSSVPGATRPVPARVNAASKRAFDGVVIDQPPLSKRKIVGHASIPAATMEVEAAVEEVAEGIEVSGEDEGPAPAGKEGVLVEHVVAVDNFIEENAAEETAAVAAEVDGAGFGRKPKKVTKSRAPSGKAGGAVAAVAAAKAAGFRLQDRKCDLTNAVQKCVPCLRGDDASCTFRQRRAWPFDGKNKDLSRPTFLPTIGTDDDSVFPSEYAADFTIADASNIKTTVSHALLDTIREEERHSRRPGSVRQRFDAREPVSCDTCLTSVFIGWRCCNRCGRELCLACCDDLEECHRSEEDEGMSQGEKEHRQRLMQCGEGRVHGGVDLDEAGDLIPFTRMDVAALEKMRRSMEEWATAHPKEQPPPLPKDMIDYLYQSRDKDAYHEPAERSHAVIHLGADLQVDEPARPLPSPPSQASLTASVDVLRSMDPQALWRALWSRGEPMVVDLDLGKSSARQWGPDDFIKYYGHQRCTIASNTGQPDNERATVAEYFCMDDRAQGESYKIKDYPPDTSFREGLPLCHEDFQNLVPFPFVTRLDGPVNLASHAPANSNAPDLGPKGYWSQFSFDDLFGSTRLHMDLSDALNYMFWSSPLPDGSPGYAAWDIFRAEDSVEIRDFLYGTKAKQLGLPIEEVRAGQDDPIHTQEFFLNSDLRRQLLEEKGVKSFRIWQRPGQIVFIPAGCAHQVCNFADCIKVAQDFVSPENVARCWTVTDEFRAQTKSRDLWREDVLQLKMQLLWAWRSCERFDGEGDGLGEQNHAGEAGPMEVDG